MKKSAILLVFLIILSFSCKKYRFYGFDINETVTINIPLDSEEDFNITEAIDVKIERLLEQEGTEADMISEITIEEVSLPFEEYLLFNELKLYISAENEDEVLLASNDIINVNTDYYTFKDEVWLEVIDEKMEDYVKQSKMNIKTQAKLNLVNLTDLDLPAGTLEVPVNFNIRFRVLTYVK